MTDNAGTAAIPRVLALKCGGLLPAPRVRILLAAILPRWVCDTKVGVLDRACVCF